MSATHSRSGAAARTRHAEHAAHHLDRVLGLLRRDEPEDHRRVSLSCLAKKAAAFLRISRSSVSVLTSAPAARRRGRGRALMRELRIGQRIRVEGRSWRIVQLYRVDQKVVIVCEEERRVIPWPASTPTTRTSGRRAPNFGSRPCEACGPRVRATGARRTATAGATTAAASAGARPSSRGGSAGGARPAKARRDSPEFSAMARDFMVDRHGEPTYWTRERIIRAFQRWADGDVDRLVGVHALDRSRGPEFAPAGRRG